MSDDKVKVLKTIKEIRVFNDPYRKEILKTLSLLSRPATAKEVAVEMNESPSKINYHMGILLKYGFIDLHHTKNINGITAKYYNLAMDVVKVQMDNPKNKDTALSAVQEMISSTFDNERDNYIKHLDKYIKDEEGNEREDHPEEYFDFINTKKIYMNAQEYQEFTAFMKNLSDKDKKGREVYSLFSSLIKLDSK